MQLKTPIYSIGTLKRMQASQRADGQWFIRTLNLQGFWQAWTTAPRRPDNAWYDPRQGKAILPVL